MHDGHHPDRGRPGRQRLTASDRTPAAIAVAVSVAFTAAACSDDATQGSSAAEEASDGVAPDGAAPSGDAASGSAAELDTLDLCALFSEVAFEALMDTDAMAAMPMPDDGSILGGCGYVGEDGSNVLIQARPADEWQYAAEAYGGAPAAGASVETVFSSSLGLLARFEGLDWFAHIMVSDSSGTWDERASVSVAETIASHI